MSRLRRAVLSDLPRLLPLGERFVEEFVPGLAFNRARTEETLTQLVAAHVCWIAQDTEGRLIGAVGLFLIDHPLSGERIASELFWYVAPEHRSHSGVGLGLLEAATQQAWANGAVRLHMIALASNESVSTIYAKLGFTRLESTWQKELV